MTLILSIANQDSMVLMADCLTSSPTGDPKLNLFSIGTNHADLRYRGIYRAHSIADKVVTVCNVTVAYAGDVSVSQTIIKTLATALAGSAVRLETIENILRGTFSNAISDGRVSLILAVQEPNGRYLAFWNCQQLQRRGFGEIVAAGSGVHHLQDYLNKASASLSAAGASPDGNVKIALTIAGAMLGSEILTRSPLLSSFGGFYELAECATAPHRKTTDYCLIFWEVNLSKTGDEFRKTKILKRLKPEAPMEFFSMDLPKQEGDPLEMTFHTVTPMARLPEYYHQTWDRDLNSKYQVHVFLGNAASGQPTTAVDVRSTDDPANHLIFFAVNGGRLTMNQRPELGALQLQVLDSFKNS